MIKQNWKKPFREEFAIHFKNSPDELKFAETFISDLLAEQKENWQKELAEKIEGMKYFIPTTKGLTILEYQREMKGYKRALTEVLKKLDDDK